MTVVGHRTRQLKTLEQFEAKVYISFQQVSLLYKSERLKKLFMARLFIISILLFKTNKIILKQYNLHCETILHVLAATPTSGVDNYLKSEEMNEMNF